MRKRIDLAGRRDITSILSEGKNKGWAQVQVVYRCRWQEVRWFLPEGLYFLCEAGTKTSDISEGWDGDSRPWEKHLKCSFQRLKCEWTRRQWDSQGWRWFKSQWKWWRGRSAKSGDVFSPIVLCCQGGDVKKVYCWVLPELLFPRKASVIKGQSKPVSIGYWQDSD